MGGASTPFPHGAPIRARLRSLLYTVVVKFGSAEEELSERPDGQPMLAQRKSGLASTLTTGNYCRRDVQGQPLPLSVTDSKEYLG